MEEKVQVEVMPDADTSQQSQEETILEQAVEKGEVSQEFGLQDDGVYKINLDEPLKTEEDAVQERKTEKVSVDEPSGDSKEVDSEVRVEPSKEETKEETKENIKDEMKVLKQIHTDLKGAEINVKISIDEFRTAANIITQYRNNVKTEMDLLASNVYSSLNQMNFSVKMITDVNNFLSKYVNTTSSIKDNLILVLTGAIDFIPKFSLYDNVAFNGLFIESITFEECSSSRSTVISSIGSNFFPLSSF